MQTSPNVPSAVDAPTDETFRFWQKLFYRWFVQYNPLYLLSAMFVLAGSSLWARGLVHEESLVGPLGIALVAELYAVSLMLGAALLTRIGFRRPAVMLSFLFLLYQWDTTLHTETSAYLGIVGTGATVVWCLLFAGKLHALAWAVRIRFSPNGLLAAYLGATGLALGPRVLPGLGATRAGSLLAVWAFSLLMLYRPGTIASAVSLDRWGNTVLRRATRAAWCVSAVLIAMHVFVWHRDHGLSLTATLLMLPLASLRYLARESRAWVLAIGVLFLAASFRPDVFSVLALLAAAALAFRAIDPRGERGVTSVSSNEAATDPYRTDATRAPTRPPVSTPLPPMDAAERARLLTGSLFSLYLSVWTLRWSAGAWPAHLVLLDAALGVVVLLAVWRTRIAAPLVPLALTYAHLVVASRIIPVPQSTVAWGETIVVLGFTLLAGALFTTFTLRGYIEAGDS